MIFVFGLDKGFVMPSGVAMRSLDRFLGVGDRVVALSVGLSEKDKSDLNACVRNATVTHIDCAGMIDPAWVPPSHVTTAAFLRYLAPRLLHDEDRCVYLDGDIVVRRDPRPMHDADLAGTSLAAVRSRVAPFAASPGGIRRWFELGIASTAPYFNSGVLVMDLARWRERKVTERLTDFLRVHGDATSLADQEALNVGVIDDWVQLDRSWNYVTHVAESFLQQPELEPTDPHIAHFAGRLKPWTYGRLPLYAEDWYSVLEETPWRGFRPVEAPAATGLHASFRRAIRWGVGGLRDFARE